MCYQLSFAWTTIIIHSCLQGYTEYHLKLVGIVEIQMQPTEGCQAVLPKGMCEAEPAVGGGDVQADRGGQGALGGEEGVGAG